MRGHLLLAVYGAVASNVADLAALVALSAGGLATGLGAKLESRRDEWATEGGRAEIDLAKCFSCDVPCVTGCLLLSRRAESRLSNFREIPSMGNSD